MESNATGATVLEEPPGVADASAGFEAFFHEQHSRLLRAMFLVTGSGSEAEELAQDAFLKVWERWDRVRAMDDPPGYLFRTAMNLFRSRYRRAVRAAKRAVGVGEPEDAFEAADRKDEVVRALAGLSPRQRAALVVTELLGYGSEEAASLLGVTAGTVRALASQGRAALRRTMERHDE